MKNRISSFFDEELTPKQAFSVIRVIEKYQNMKYLIIFSTAFLFLSTLSAQFFVNGDAISFGDTCFQLTEAQNWQVGSIWHPDKIDLSQSFNLVAHINLGNQNESGADGIVFGLQPISTNIGASGGAIGFGNVRPSLGVEIDTYQNFDLGDPEYDHLAIISNGNLNHNTNEGSLAAPILAASGQNNIEDGQFHDFTINWDAPNHLFEVYFDCNLRLTYTGDIVHDIFNDDPLVYWGFTSATGALNNLQQVCINYSTFLDRLEDKVMCPGGQVLLDVNSGLNYEWTPTEGLNDPTIYNPIASPDTTTTYTVKISDNCGFSFLDDVQITVNGDSTLVDIGQDSILCEGDQLLLDASTELANYLWSTGETTAGIFAEQAGVYEVTVTKTDIICVVEDRITIDNRPRPFIDLGTDTTLCIGQSLWLDATFPEASYEWQNGSIADSILVANEDVYQVVLTHPCGIISDQINVFYEDCHELYLPNVFSPNLDGINDLFFPMDGGDVSLIHHFQIFDRWGGLVFEQKDFMPNVSSLGWQGKHKGKAVAQGVYVWYLDVSFRDGFREKRTGGLTLIR